MNPFEKVEIMGEDFSAVLLFNAIIISQTRDGVLSTLVVSDSGDCNLLIDALEKIKQDKLLILKGLENNGQ